MPTAPQPPMTDAELRLAIEGEHAVRRAALAAKHAAERNALEVSGS